MLILILGMWGLYPQLAGNEGKSCPNVDLSLITPSLIELDELKRLLYETQECEVIDILKNTAWPIITQILSFLTKFMVYQKDNENIVLFEGGFKGPHWSIIRSEIDKEEYQKYFRKSVPIVYYKTENTGATVFLHQNGLWSSDGIRWKAITDKKHKEIYIDHFGKENLPAVFNEKKEDLENFVFNRKTNEWEETKTEANGTNTYYYTSDCQMIRATDGGFLIDYDLTENLIKATIPNENTRENTGIPEEGVIITEETTYEDLKQYPSYAPRMASYYSNLYSNLPAGSDVAAVDYILCNSFKSGQKISAESIELLMQNLEKLKEESKSPGLKCVKDYVKLIAKGNDLEESLLQDYARKLQTSSYTDAEKMNKFANTVTLLLELGETPYQKVINRESGIDAYLDCSGYLYFLFENLFPNSAIAKEDTDGEGEKDIDLHNVATMNIYPNRPKKGNPKVARQLHPPSDKTGYVDYLLKNAKAGDLLIRKAPAPHVLMVTEEIDPETKERTLFVVDSSNYNPPNSKFNTQDGLHRRRLKEGWFEDYYNGDNGKISQYKLIRPFDDNGRIYDVTHKYDRPKEEAIKVEDGK